MDQQYQVGVAAATVMQLATISEDGPWVCSVYFIFDNGKLYWLSEPEREHSKHIGSDSRCALTVVLKDDVPVVGVQMSGNAEIVHDGVVVKRVLDLYIAKYGVGDQFYSRFIAGSNKHDLYCFNPVEVKVFDETTKKSV